VLPINQLHPLFLPFAGVAELAQTSNSGRLDVVPRKRVSLCPHIPMIFLKHPRHI
jgi:hypothetical protein